VHGTFAIFEDLGLLGNGESPQFLQLKYLHKTFSLKQFFPKFETGAHPRHQVSWIRLALDILSYIIRSLGIMLLDANDPAASTFTCHAVPVVDTSSEQYFSASQSFTSSLSIPIPTQLSAQQQQSAVDTTTSGSRYSCDALSLGGSW
jgi:hypothetical protein